MLINDMPEDSFNFGNVNSVLSWGVKCIKKETLLPKKRERKIQVPFKDGKYDFGAKNYEEKSMRVFCQWQSTSDDETYKDLFSEMAYILSKKNKITFYDEQHKYYIGEIYKEPQLIKYFKLNEVYVVDFEVEFICQPFAYSELKILNISNGNNDIEYNGTHSSKPLLILRNDGESDISSIYLNITKKGN